MMTILSRASDRVFTIVFPVFFLALTLFIERGLGYTCFSSCEDGPIENFQAFLMLIAFFVGVGILRMPKNAYPAWARVFFAIGVAGALYCFLEEISYGQRIFGWVTPEVWDTINDQQETNLHNTSAWLDQKPRMILEIGIIIGGLIIPALKRWKPQVLPQKWALVYPDSRLTVIALFVVGIHLYQKITEWAGRQDLFLIERGSEFQETYMFWFVLIYLLFKKRELKA